MANGAVMVLLALLAQEAPAEWLVAGPFGGGGREVLTSDAVLAELLGPAEPRWPEAGGKIGSRTWTVTRAGEKGEVRHGALASGYAYARVDSPDDRVVICAIRGASTFFVNGEPFVGDVYTHGYTRVPILLRRGENHILVRNRRGAFSMTFEAPTGPVAINGEDATLCDVVDGRVVDGWCAVPLLNATVRTLREVVVEADGEATRVPSLAPLAVLKVPFRARQGPDVRVRVRVEGVTAEATLRMRERKSGQSFKRTFVSAIDGSVQYYSVLLPTEFSPDTSYALVLSLHGAAVEATNQTDAYSARDWAIIVAPTNRRPFGFDWEDWGRLDGLEVLDHAMGAYRVDGSRVYLTGHSMGGHGTWHFAVHFADRFAAAAPSAGWISMWSYGGASERDGGMESLFRRAMAPSDTLSLVRNLERLPLFVIHGDADESVPVSEARKMVKELEAFHRDYRVLEEKGARHWWDRPGTPGVDCVNLSELFDFFQHHRRPEKLDAIEFATQSPAAGSRSGWIEIVAQRVMHERSQVKARIVGDRATLETANVAHLRLYRGRSASVDGQQLELERLPADLVRRGESWVSGAPQGLRKSPALYGPFKQAFHRPFLLVYATGGSQEDERATLARARYDAQVWWYRGNGLGRVMADRDVTDEMARTNNLILYGNEAVNRRWKALAGSLPWSVRPGRLGVPGGLLSGDLAFVGVYPNPEEPSRLLGVVGATGSEAYRAWMATDFFVSGVGFPDFAAWTIDVHRKGLGAARAAGYFDADWTWDSSAAQLRRDY